MVDPVHHDISTGGVRDDGKMNSHAGSFPQAKRLAHKRVHARLVAGRFAFDSAHAQGHALSIWPATDNRIRSDDQGVEVSQCSFTTELLPRCESGEAVCRRSTGWVRRPASGAALAAPLELGSVTAARDASLPG